MNILRREQRGTVLGAQETSPHSSVVDIPESSYQYGYNDDYGYYSDGSGGGRRLLDVRGLLRLARLYWRTFAVILLMVLGAGIVAALSIPDRFTGESRVVVLADQVNIIDLDAITTGVSGDQVGLLSEIEMVRSRDVLTRVLDSLGTGGQMRIISAERKSKSMNERITATRERLAGIFSGESSVLDGEANAASSTGAEISDADIAAISTQWEQEDPSTWVDDLPLEASILEELGPDGVYRSSGEWLERNLSVGQVGRSRVISIKVTAPEPRIAADLANRISTAYIGAQINAKFEAARRANALLVQQLEDLRSQISQQEREIELYRSRTGLTNADAATLAAERVQQLNDTLTNARAELAAIQARKLEAESVRETRSLLESTADVIDSTLVEDLRVREIELEQEAITLRDRLLPGHPELVRVNRELGQIRARIGAEIGKVVQSISSEENTLIAEIEVLERTLETADTDVVRLNKAEREIQALSMELVTNRSLLETFVARSRETEVQEDFQQADAQVIAPAEIPHNPSGPNRMIWSLLSFIAAIGAAGGGVVLRDRADPRARTIDAIRDITKIPLLSILPDVGGLLRSKRLALHEIVRTDKTANITDIMRRTYLKLSTSPKTSAPVGEANARSGKPAGHVILVTSSRPDEGKTSTACSLAMTARRFGKSVLVIDGDLRRPSIAQAFGIKSDIGIADYLCEEANLDEIIDEEPSLGIHCIVRGSPVSDPAELVDLNQMRRLLDVLARHYDLVVIDSAPVLAAPETRELARLADQIIFVMNWKNTKRREFASAIGEMSGIAHFDDRASLILNQVPAVEMRFLEVPKQSYLNYVGYADYSTTPRKG